MGQKVNPNGFRVGVIKDWNTRWYASKKDFADFVITSYSIHYTKLYEECFLRFPSCGTMFFRKHIWERFAKRLIFCADKPNA